MIEKTLGSISREDACRPGRCTVYDVGAGRRTAVADVITEVEAVAGRPLPVRHRPPVEEPAALLADAGRIERELGWRPERSDLRRIVADAYAATGGSVDGAA